MAEYGRTVPGQSKFVDQLLYEARILNLHNEKFKVNHDPVCFVFPQDVLVQ